MIKKYIEYIKDNPQGYWFKRKIFGWGWIPAKKEGWFVILGYILILLGLAFTVDEKDAAENLIFTFFLPILILTVLLIVICYNKGEKPKWQWGFPKDKKE